jgi:hypothetical protein
LTYAIRGHLHFPNPGISVNAHVFVDESKARGLLLAAGVVPAQELANLRRLIDSLRMPRQRRIHFTAESDQRGKVILRALHDAGTLVSIYDATSHGNVKSARDAALTRLVDDAAKIPNGVGLSTR